MTISKPAASLFVFGLLCLVYTWFSYAFTDPNLVLSTWTPYWQFQTWMWSNVFSNKGLLVGLFTGLIVGLFVSYILVVRQLYAFSSQTVRKKHIYVYGLLLGCLLFSYNALSHDVFNYIFNAKMVVVYQENPHLQTALQHPDDDWTRFMHNTHTSAPYGYGWTAVSLVPFIIGQQVFSLTWMLFRALEILAVGALYWVLQKGARILFKRELGLGELALLFLNPLFLIEVVSNMHNDLWMMVPGLAAVIVTVKYSSQIVKAILFGGGLLALSASIKFATILLIVPMALVLVQRIVVEKLINKYLARIPFSNKISHWLTTMIERWTSMFLPLLSSVLLFLPLFLPRSQHFHPWYLVWSMSWLPLIKQRYWKLVLLAFSLSSLLRYLPWMYEGGYDSETLSWQRGITWGLPVVILLIWLVIQNIKTQKNLRNTV